MHKNKSYTFLKKSGFTRNENWKDKETAVLIGIWEGFVDTLNSTRRTGRVYAHIAREFADLGYNRKPIEVQKKISNLAQEYRKEVSKTVQGHGPTKWRFFADVENVVNKLRPRSRDPQLDADGQQRLSTDRYPTDVEMDSDCDDSISLSSDGVKFVKVCMKSDGENDLNDEEDYDDEDEGDYDEDDDANDSSLEILRCTGPGPVASNTPQQPPRVNTPLPVIVSVHGNAVMGEPRHNSERENAKTSIMLMKEEMKDLMKESADIERAQAILQLRCDTVQEKILKLMDQMLEHC